MKESVKAVKGATLIAANTQVNGNVHFDDQLFINGTVEGDITADHAGKATLIVSDEGVVRGQIRVPNIVINGTVEGDVHAGTRVEIAAKARVKGNVYYKLIEMQLGAKVDGQMLHADDAGAEIKVHRLRVNGDESDSG
ncbi:MAG: polymer-forming cytoskeletal protein [Gammaproteobacteria bacterium]|nr:polymer-forming cytoskeletal protein [Gammaproteobacteria bacterium]